MDAFETVRDMEEAELTSLALEQQAAATSPLHEVRRRLATISQAMAKVRLKKVGLSLQIINATLVFFDMI